MYGVLFSINKPIKPNKWMHKTIDKEKKDICMYSMLPTDPPVNKYCAASKVCHVILDHWASHQYFQLLFTEQIYTESMFDLHSYLFHGQ